MYYCRNIIIARILSYYCPNIIIRYQHYRQVCWNIIMGTIATNLSAKYKLFFGHSFITIKASLESLQNQKSNQYLLLFESQFVVNYPLNTKDHWAWVSIHYVPASPWPYTASYTGKFYIWTYTFGIFDVRFCISACLVNSVYLLLLYLGAGYEIF